MDVEIVRFPTTNLAVIEHHGSPLLEHETVNKLIKWRQENNLFDNEKYRCYGIHYTNPAITPLEQHHVDFAISIDKPIDKIPMVLSVKPFPRSVVPKHVILVHETITKLSSIYLSSGYHKVERK